MNIVATQLANQIQEYIKKVIHHDKGGFIPGWDARLFNIHISVDMIHRIK